MKASTIKGETTAYKSDSICLNIYNTRKEFNELGMSGRYLYFSRVLTIEIIGNKDGYIWGNIESIMINSEDYNDKEVTVVGKFSSKIEAAYQDKPVKPLSQWMLDRIDEFYEKKLDQYFSD